MLDINTMIKFKVKCTSLAAQNVSLLYTFVDLFIQRNSLDEDYCKSALIPKLESFYEKHVRPFIASCM